jgi:hypothetical protein
VDCWKLNAQTKMDPFPLPFLELVLNFVVGHEICSFMDHNQVEMPRIYKEKTTYLFNYIFFKMRMKAKTYGIKILITNCL